MLRMEVIINDELWPNLTIMISRESYARGKVFQSERKQYDLCYGKAEEMCHNHLRPMIEEVIKRHQR